MWGAVTCSGPRSWDTEGNRAGGSKPKSILGATLWLLLNGHLKKKILSGHWPSCPSTSDAALCLLYSVLFCFKLNL